MKVLVTGATGFVGSHVTDVLQQRGHTVYAISRSAQDWRSQPPALPALHWLKCDLHDACATRDLVRDVRPDAAVHLAWYAVPKLYWAARENVGCVQFSLTLAQALADAGCKRLLAIGSCAEYDWRYGMCSEDYTPIKPETLYGVCKDATRRILEAFCSQATLSFVWARLFYLYGPREPADRLVSSVARSLLTRTAAPTTSGSQCRDFLHVADAASALCATLESDVVGSVNIGSGVAVPVRFVVETLGRLAQSSESLRIGGLQDSPAEAPLVVADIRRLQRETTWRPEWPLEPGLLNTLEWWRQQGVR